MARWIGLGLGIVVALAWAPGASAQYYAPGYAPPGYAPPPAYYPPPVRELGGRCNVRLPPAYGARRMVCNIIRPRPIGRPCACPPPPPPPGYAYGPDLGGRVIP